MKTVIFDGSMANDSTGGQVRETLVFQLKERGWKAVEIVLREKKIGACGGCFFCWVRTPGICTLDDDNRAISEEVMSSDLLIYLTPVTFGGYSSILKGMVDHLIPNISPYFQAVNGETHHKQRYKTYPNLMTIGWMDEPDPQAESIFRYLTIRNSINFFAPKQYSGVLTGNPSADQIKTSVETWLDDMDKGIPSQPVTTAEISKFLEPAAGSDTAPPKHAILLAESPKKQTSVSHALGQDLYQRLASHGVQTEIVSLHTAVRSPEKMAALLESIDSSDLITLTFPLYVDSLPAPVFEVLEKILDHRLNIKASTRPRFCAVSNCGFPEAIHNTSSLAICAAFARQAGFTWGGGLALGGGGMLSGKPLEEEGGRAARIRNALKLAADALAQGSAIPHEARDMMAKPVMPAWLYRIGGGFGWRSMAKKYGMQKELDRTPYTR